MYGLITKLALLLSILILLPLASASAEFKRVPLILMDRGSFDFRGNMPVADLEGTGVSTHLGQIVSTGVFRSLGPGPPERFTGRIEGTATTVVSNQMATATSSETATATLDETAAARSKPDSITYRLSAEFRPDASGVFYGIGTYVITGGTGKFKRATGVGVFVGLALFANDEYNCFLRGVISY